MDRRRFLAGTGATAAAASLPWSLHSTDAPTRIMLLHTNDTHSHIEPFGSGEGKLSGRGGTARRATLVKQLKAKQPNTLLLDAGDVFQGTPYFNRYKGLLDYQLMSMMGYDAGTFGNHDFDNGVEGLVAAMAEAKFPMVNCNFNAKGAPELAKRFQPHLVKSFPGIKVGITGVCVAFQGLVAPKNHTGVEWMDPEKSLKPIIQNLREREKVDMVVVLSHLGHDMQGTAIDDLNLARLVPGIDVIIGGHSHTFMDEPVVVENPRGKTHIFQVGWGGVNLGRMEFSLHQGNLKAANSMAVPVTP